MEQVGIVVPGQANDLNQAIDPLLGNEYSTLGETPNNTTLTVTYRVGGGIDSNVPSVDLTTVSAGSSLADNGTSIANLTVTNNHPARGGKDGEDTNEIKERAKAFFTTQNRCVTKEDYEARVMNIPAKYGNVAKAYVSRNENTFGFNDQPLHSSVAEMSTYGADLLVKATNINNIVTAAGHSDTPTYPAQEDGSAGDAQSTLEGLWGFTNHLEFMLSDDEDNTAGGFQEKISNISDLIPELASEFHSFMSSVNIYVLAYNNSKELVGNPITTYVNSSVTDNVPSILMQNIKNYLTNFKILTDTVQILDGYIVNFGVFFDVFAEKYADKQKVKLLCIEKIKDYFRIEKMQFNQPIYVSNLEFELMGIEGVRSVNYVTITQHEDQHPNGTGDELDFPTWNYSYLDSVDIDGNPDNGDSGGFDANGTPGYGYMYDFSEGTGALKDGIIRPPSPSTPTVFELKNPNQNIKGKVR
jgi:hypothetical protein